MSKAAVNPPDPVRPARVEDIPEVIRLAGLMFESMGVDASCTQWRRESERMLQHAVGDEVMLFVVDQPARAGPLAACGAGVITQRLPGPLHPHGRWGYIQWMFTDARHRSRGLAGAIVRALLDWFHTQGVTRVELHATPAGENLYRSLGFAEPDNVQLQRCLS